VLIDIHNHIVPAVDDGPETFSAASELLDLALSHGISHVVATPHIQSGRYDNQPQNLLPAFKQFQTQLEANGQKLSLALACEARIDDSLIERVCNQQVLYLGHWQDKLALLLEFPTNRYPHGALKLISWLIKKGIQPIIAHPERHRFFTDEPIRLNQYLKQGCLLQITAASLLGDFGTDASQFADKLLKEDKVTFIASDAHNMAYRPFRLVQAQYALEERYSASSCRKWFYENPRILTESLFAHPDRALVA
jgi:protein-tyrosine phosphatase